jgi:glycosyltransferase involved in cell wall biosynthesis
MNLLFLNHYAGTPLYGMEYRPYYLAKEWVKLGHQVTIVAASESHLRTQAVQASHDITYEMIDGISYIWLKTPAYKGNGAKRVINIFAFVAQLFRHSHRLIHQIQPDIVINSSTYPLDIYPARYIARRAKAKLVFEVHDLWPLSPIELGGMSPRHPFIMLMQRAENAACKSADYVVSLLPKAKQHLQDHGMAPHKFSCLPNGIDIAEWQDNQATIPIEHRAALHQLRQNGHFIIGYAGGHAISNALTVLIDAANQLKHNASIVFVLVGKGIEKDALRQKADSLGLTNVIFLPPVPKSAIPDLLCQMDALYIGWQNHPIYRFGISPNKIMDYMMAAKPVLHSISAGNDPVAESGCGISVAAEDAVAIAQAAQDLAAMSESERNAMGIRGKEYVMNNHDYSVLANKFIQIVQPSRSTYSPHAP